MRLVILLLTSLLFGVGLASPIGVDTPTGGDGGVTDEWPEEYRVEVFRPPYLLSSAPTTDSSLADTVTFNELAPSLDGDAASDNSLTDIIYEDINSADLAASDKTRRRAPFCFCQLYSAPRTNHPQLERIC
jgi:hypothetical protein